jgi:L-ascorbate metabolism protein UlaG (beta-lactamase superfamily)
MTNVDITLIGGPTALIELPAFRLLTDPTFDDAGDYQLPHVILRKMARPALAAAQIGTIDAVLLSHDQHTDNLDNSGRAFLPKAGRVFTTVAGAGRLGGNADGLKPWETRKLTSANGERLLTTATPPRHGPAGIEPLSGDVTGFVLSSRTNAFKPLYITEDTVWFDGVGPATLPAWSCAPVCGRSANEGQV